MPPGLDMDPGGKLGPVTGRPDKDASGVKIESRESRTHEDEDEIVFNLNGEEPLPLIRAKVSRGDAAVKVSFRDISWPDTEARLWEREDEEKSDVQMSNAKSKMITIEIPGHGKGQTEMPYRVVSLNIDYFQLANGRGWVSSFDEGCPYSPTLEIRDVVKYQLRREDDQQILEVTEDSLQLEVKKGASVVASISSWTEGVLHDNDNEKEVYSVVVDTFDECAIRGEGGSAATARRELALPPLHPMVARPQVSEAYLTKPIGMLVELAGNPRVLARITKVHESSDGDNEKRGPLVDVKIEETDDNLRKKEDRERPINFFAKRTPIKCDRLKQGEWYRLKSSRVVLKQAGVRRGVVRRVRHERRENDTELSADVAFEDGAWQRRIPLSALRVQPAIGDTVRAARGRARWAFAPPKPDAKVIREAACVTLRLPDAQVFSLPEAEGGWPAVEHQVALIDAWKIAFRGPTSDNLTDGEGWPWSVLLVRVAKEKTEQDTTAQQAFGALGTSATTVTGSAVRRAIACPPTKTRPELIFDDALALRLQRGEIMRITPTVALFGLAPRRKKDERVVAMLDGKWTPATVAHCYATATGEYALRESGNNRIHRRIADEFVALRPNDIVEVPTIDGVGYDLCAVTGGGPVAGEPPTLLRVKPIAGGSEREVPETAVRDRLSPGLLAFVVAELLTAPGATSAGTVEGLSDLATAFTSTGTVEGLGDLAMAFARDTPGAEFLGTAGGAAAPLSALELVRRAVEIAQRALAETPRLAGLDDNLAWGLPWTQAAGDEYLSLFLPFIGGEIFKEVQGISREGSDGPGFDKIVDRGELHFTFGRNEMFQVRAQSTSPGVQKFARFADSNVARFFAPGALSAFALDLAYAAHAASEPALYAAMPSRPSGWNGTMGKIFGAAYADSRELALSKQGYAMHIALALRVGSAFAAGVVSDSAPVAAAAATSALDSAQRHAQLGRLVLRRQLALNESFVQFGRTGRCTRTRDHAGICVQAVRTERSHRPTCRVARRPRKGAGIRQPTAPARRMPRTRARACCEPRGARCAHRRRPTCCVCDR